MTKRTHLECDGCGQTELVDQAAEPTIIKQGVLVSLNGRADQSYDLCFSCEQTLARNCDPKAWARPSVQTPA
jgi:hypothetical protein